MDPQSMFFLLDLSPFVPGVLGEVGITTPTSQCMTNFTAKREMTQNEHVYPPWPPGPSNRWVAGTWVIPGTTWYGRVLRPGDISLVVHLPGSWELQIQSCIKRQNIDVESR